MLTSILGEGATASRAVVMADATVGVMDRALAAVGTDDVDDGPQPTTSIDTTKTAATAECFTATSEPDPRTTTGPRQAVPEATMPSGPGLRDPNSPYSGFAEVSILLG